VLITVSCLEYGGIASPLAMGVVTVLLCRSIIFADHWRRGIVPVGLVVLLYPLTLVVMGMTTPVIGDQFSDSRAVASFLLNMTFVSVAGGIVIAGGHLVWGLRRQVYNSRALGRYKLKKRIGAGGMGEVWLAHHNALRRDVAVKILRPENANEQKAIARFEREVRATSELCHPNTVRVFDYGVTDDGLWYYAMEHLRGTDLHDAVSRGGVMAPLRAAGIIAQAARALAEAHARGIVHRDIKPENIFLASVVGESDFVKVLDFGLAKMMEHRAGSDPTLTQAGWAVGTPQWVSPEVVFGKDADARSDIYGLGAVLYFLLCRQSPFGLSDMRQVLRAHMDQTPMKPSHRLGRSLPEGLEAIVMRCLAKDPAQRYQSASDLAAELDAWCLAPQLGAAPAERHVSIETRPAHGSLVAPPQPLLRPEPSPRPDAAVIAATGSVDPVTVPAPAMDFDVDEHFSTMSTVPLPHRPPAQPYSEVAETVAVPDPLKERGL
jgi:serine/threonine-protein kinase